MRQPYQLPDLPDVGDVIRVTAPALNDQAPLTFFVVVSSEHAPLAMRKARAAAVVQQALLAMRPLGLPPHLSIPAELLTYDELQSMGTSQSEAARLFEDIGQHGAQCDAPCWVCRPIFIVPNPAPYMYAWHSVRAGRLQA